jgi:hypothetical protein
MSRCLAFVVLLTCLLAVPAAEAQDASPAASPEAGTQSETLFSITVPAAALPAGQWWVEIGTAEQAPGTTNSTYGGDVAPGVGAVLVASGTYAVTAEGPLVVLRGPDATPELAAPGTEAVLMAGDVLVYPDTAVHRTRRVVGEEPVAWVRLFVEGPDRPGGGIATPAVGSSVVVDLAQSSMSEEAQAVAGIGTGPVTLTLRRVTLAPGTALPPLVDEAYAVRAVAEGKASWSLAPSRMATPAPYGGPTEGFIIKGLTLPAVAGYALVIENAEQVPLVFYEATIAPAAPDAAPRTEARI